jgi:hypothetical protein
MPMPSFEPGRVQILESGPPRRRGLQWDFAYDALPGPNNLEEVEVKWLPSGQLGRQKFLGKSNISF